MSRKRTVTFVIILIIEALILISVVLIARILRSNVRIVSTPISQWQSRYTTFSESGWHMGPEKIPEDQSPEDELDMIYGPFFALEKGAYSVTVEYECETDQEFSVYSFENGGSILQLEEEVLKAAENTFTGHFFAIGDISDLEVRVRYNGEGDLTVKNIYIATSYYWLRFAVIGLAMFFLFADAIWIRQRAGDERTPVELLKYRSVWMAVAMVMVMIYHSGIDFGTGAINSIRDIGYGGVDIFFFASGMGCYLSYTKNSDAGAFLKRRIQRLLPAYAIYMIPWLSYKVIVDDMKFRSVLGNLFSVESIKGTPDAFNWYIGALWIFYILAPYLATFVRNRINTYIHCILLIGVTVVFSLVFWDCYDWIIIVTRIPIFLLGMFMAKLHQSQRNVMNIGERAIIFLVSVTGGLTLAAAYSYFPSKLWNHGWHWYPFILIVPGLCVMLSDASQRLFGNTGRGAILHSVNRFGGTTWELYLVHIGFIRLVRSMIAKGLVQEGNLPRILALVISVPVAYLLKWCTERIKGKMNA